MSVDTSYIFCTRCEFEQTYPSPDYIYKYRLLDGDEEYIPKCIGWCMHCNSFVGLQEGLKVSDLKKGIKSMEAELMNIEKSILYRLFSIRKRRFMDLIYLIGRDKKYLTVLNGVDSLHSCLKCSCTEVFPIYGDIEKYSHIDCGGHFRHIIDEKAARFHIRYDDKYITPVFVSGVEILDTRNRFFN